MSQTKMNAFDFKIHVPSNKLYCWYFVFLLVSFTYKHQRHLTGQTSRTQRTQRTAGSQTPGSEPWYVVRGAASVVVAADFEMFLSGYEKWNCTNCSCTASVCMGIGWVCAHTDILTHSSARLIDARKQFTHWKKRLQSTTSAVRERNSAATCRAATKNYRK